MIRELSTATLVAIVPVVNQAPAVKVPSQSCTVHIAAGTQGRAVTVHGQTRDLESVLKAHGFTVRNDSRAFTTMTDVEKGFTYVESGKPVSVPALKYAVSGANVVIIALNVEDFRYGDLGRMKYLVQQVREAGANPIIMGLSLVYGWAPLDDIEASTVAAFNRQAYTEAQLWAVPYVMAPPVFTSWTPPQVVEAIKKGGSSPEAALGAGAITPTVYQACT